jgi:hypothetical protein
MPIKSGRPKLLQHLRRAYAPTYKEPCASVCSSCEIKYRLPSKITVSWGRGVMPTSKEVYSLFRPEFSSSTSVREYSEFFPVSNNAKDEHKTKFWYINQPCDFSTLHCSHNNKLQTNTSFLHRSVRSRLPTTYWTSRFALTQTGKHSPCKSQ